MAQAPHTAYEIACLEENTFETSQEILDREQSHPSRVLCIVNTKSGARGSAPKLLEGFRNKYGGENVLDTARVSEDRDAMKKFLAPDRSAKARVIVAGGDGTVAWVMDTVDGQPWENLADRPHLGVVPLGTGNDFSRALGFGPGYTKGPVETLLTQFDSSRLSLIDRWDFWMACNINGQRADVFKTMNNYLSIGVDGKIAGDFHHFRETHPKLASTRLANKFWYGVLSLAGSASGSPDLRRSVSLLVDNVEVNLTKEFQSIVVVNIDSFASGIKIWPPHKGDEFPGDQKYDDGKLEVATFSGVTHLGMAKGNVKRPLKVAQGRVITLRCHTPPSGMQLDGEPINPGGPCEIILRRKSKFKTLYGPLKAS